ncbi:hypothetical protein OH456_08545 [Vibrio sp. La 4.2.2]|uniref:hypothetical protein n=1 Tax=Vibrio sp. La 4.2.2 TaxID=2998830 RepID=UPI0022CE1E8A|nr:hypothetical protein [Vibrio sp. La 4.2.2]MDA0108191.1 hypothetical protein [Vibrio sp. La 4.2.2]
MNDELIEAVQENILLWLAYMELGKITHSDASQRIEAYYLGLAEVLEIKQLSNVLPYFTDARAYLHAASPTLSTSMFLSLDDFSDINELNQAKRRAEGLLDKHIQLTVRRLTI